MSASATLQLILSADASSAISAIAAAQQALTNTQSAATSTTDTVAAASRKVAETSGGAASAVQKVNSAAEKSVKGTGKMKDLQKSIKGVEEGSKAAATAVGAVSGAATGGLATVANRITGAITGIAGSVVNLTTAAIASAAGVASLTGAMIKLATSGAKLEQTRIAFHTLMGSVEDGNAMLAKFQEFANVTPFSTDEIVNSGKKLLAFGVQAQDVMSVIKMLGDVSAGTQKPIEELTFLFGKAFARGRVDAEMLNQMIGAGIPIVEALGDHFSVASEDIFKLAQQGKIAGTDIQAVFQKMTSEGGQYFNLMEKQSKSLGGLWSTLSGKISLSFQTLGEQLVPIFSSIVENVIGSVDEIYAKIKDGTVVAWIADAAGSAVGGISKIVQFFVSAWGVMKGIFNVISDTIKSIIRGFQSLFLTAIGYVIEGLKNVVNGSIEAYNVIATKFGGKRVAYWNPEGTEKGFKEQGKEYMREAVELAARVQSGESYRSATRDSDATNKRVQDWAKTAQDFLAKFKTSALEKIEKINEDEKREVTSKEKEERDSLFEAKGKSSKAGGPNDSLARVGLYTYSSEQGAQLKAVLDTNSLLRGIDSKLSRLTLNPAEALV